MLHLIFRDDIDLYKLRYFMYNTDAHGLFNVLIESVSLVFRISLVKF